jgi:hypothetical protein
VELVRNERGSTFDIRCREDDVVTNLPFQERLKADFGVQLPEIDDSEPWLPSDYFAAVEAVTSGQSRWQIDKNGMQLGFFSFAKLLMLHDLEPKNWPEKIIVQHDLVQRLLQNGFLPDVPLFSDDEKLDTRLDPENIVQVIDADASQTRVIEEVRAGRNLVVQGPPGTGKSQTITNIIAATVHDGKSVLFMAEKKAALDVVHRRLQRVRLSDICLELHSRNANKKAVLQEIERTLTTGHAVPAQPSAPDALRKARDRLNRIADCLHDILPGNDYSPFSAMAEIVDFIGQKTSPPLLKAVGLHELTNEKRDDLIRKIEAFRDIFKKAGPAKSHPFRGVAALDIQPTDLQRLEDELIEADKEIVFLLEHAISVSAKLVFPCPKTLIEVERLIILLDHAKLVPDSADVSIPVFFARKNDRVFGKALDSGCAWYEAWSRGESTFSDAAWSVPIDEIRMKISKGVGSFWSRLFGGYRGASRELSVLLKVPLPIEPKARQALLDQLFSIRQLRLTLAQSEKFLSEALGKLWRGEQTDFQTLNAVQGWVNDLLSMDSEITIETAQKLVAFREMTIGHSQQLVERVQRTSLALQAVLNRLKLDVDTPQDLRKLDLEIIRNRFVSMYTAIDRYPEWVEFAQSVNILNQAGLSSLLDSLESGQLLAERVIDEFRYAVAEARWSNARTIRPALNDIAQLDRHLLVQTFHELDCEWFSEVQTLILAKHLAQLPKGAAGEMGIIRGEIAKKRGHKPIRKIIGLAGNMIRRIKPVFLMSPISIAQFLPPGSMEFDLLVIDEASQVRPEDALGAVARARQIVVVGDKKQLPPTSFFDRLFDNVSEEDQDEDGVESVTAKATEMESILTLCEARGVNSSMLEWHYRSRDPSLIRVSNAEFYKDRLILPPSPLQMNDNYGLKFTHVPGVYSSKNCGGGRPRTNRIEAEYIVNALVSHAHDWPTLSVGIVAFSKTQSDMIAEVLEIHRRKNVVLDALLREGKAEDVFVKNLENVQGDERDVILISVGYGPHEPNGRLASMTFGPVNSKEGERRLNVIFSRARVRCEVFASFDPDDIDLTRISNEGPRVLKRFLEFAKTRQLDEKLITGQEAESPFEEEVARVIASFGYYADFQVGSAGFRIDIGVRHADHPGNYILAVECDGATWHRALWARERDRLRQDVLENLGWHFHRIWSTDWFYRRDQEISRLREALEAAKEVQSGGISIKGSNKDRRFLDVQKIEFQIPSDEVNVDLPNIKAPPYRKAEVRMPNSMGPHELHQSEMEELVVKIVNAEGPIHYEEVARRVTSAFGKQRTGGRIQAVVNASLEGAKQKASVLSDGVFWFTAEQKDVPPVRNRSAEMTPTTKAEYLSPLEIRAAAKMITAENGAMNQREMIRAISRLLGFLRVGKDLHDSIVKALN